ncbi:ABC transporter substrate-binding protein [Thermococcus sp.]
MRKGLAALVILLTLFSVVAAGCIGGGTTTSTSSATPSPTSSPTKTQTATQTTSTSSTTQSPSPTETSTTTQSAAGITLIVLTRHDTTIQLLAKKAFLKSDIAKKYNIVNIKFIKATESQWITLIKKGADVGWGGGPTLFDTLYQDGYLAPITDKNVLGLIGKDIPESIGGMPMIRKGSDGKIYWIAAALSSFGFTVNKNALKRWNLPVPQKWEDIASETFAIDPPQFGIADPTRSTSNTRIYQIILQTFGWDKGWQILTIIAANSKVYDASDAVREAVIQGDIAAGNTIDFYGYIAMQANPACVYIIPKGESIINGDPIALLKYSQHPKAAQAFIYWVLTDGQKVWLNKEVNRLPVNPKIFDTPEGKKRPDLKNAYYLALYTKGIKFDDKEALDTVYAMQFYFKATLVDTNDALHRAWIALVDAHKKGKIDDATYEKLKAELLAPIQFKDPDTGKMVTFTEDYAKKINQKIIKDPGFKDTLLQEWRNAARDKYNKVLQEVQG